MKRLLLALPLLALAACASDKAANDQDVLMKCDFDMLLGWIPDPAVLAKDKAHSGSYSLRVDQSREYAPGYSLLLGQLSSPRLRGIRLDGWVYMTDKNSTASIVVVVKDRPGGQDLLNTYVEYGKVKEYEKWVPISQEILFPATTSYTSQLLIYLWRANAQSPAYLDDLKLTALR